MPVLNGVLQQNIPSIGVTRNIAQQAQTALTAKAVETEQGQISGLTGSEKQFHDLTGINPYADTASREKYADWMLSENSANTAREYTAQREDSQYQRLVKDLRAAGINPGILAQSGASPVSSASQGVNYQGSEMTSAKNTNQTSGTQIITRLLAASALLLLKLI